MKNLIKKLLREGLEGARLIGYKVMPVVNGKISSGANSRLDIDIRIGRVISMPGNGVYLSLNKQYVLDYYSELAEEEALITFEFNQSDITTGNVTDIDTEVSVTKVLVKNIETI